MPGGNMTNDHIRVKSFTNVSLLKGRYQRFPSLYPVKHSDYCPPPSFKLFAFFPVWGCHSLPWINYGEEPKPVLPSYQIISKFFFFSIILKILNLKNNKNNEIGKQEVVQSSCWYNFESRIPDFLSRSHPEAWLHDRRKQSNAFLCFNNNICPF